MALLGLSLWANSQVSCVQWACLRRGVFHTTGLSLTTSCLVRVTCSTALFKSKTSPLVPLWIFELHEEKQCCPLPSLQSHSDRHRERLQPPLCAVWKLLCEALSGVELVSCIKKHLMSVWDIFSLVLSKLLETLELKSGVFSDNKP